MYWAHYIKKQSSTINEYLDEVDKIPAGLVTAILIINYISLAMFIPYILVEEGHPVEAVSNLIDFISAIFFLVWGFKARSRMNHLLTNGVSKERWFSGLWTFFFTPLYFNYKVNRISVDQPDVSLTNL